MKKKSEFKNEKEFYKYLSANKSELIAFKKAALKFTDSFGVEAETQKTLSTNNVDDIANGIIKRTIIGNTYNWMDSHDDVHVENTFGKSIAERQDKIWHLHDHEQKITSKVGKPTSIYEKQIAWKDLGIEKEGRTICLCMDSNIMKDMNAGVFGQYLAKEITQHSVAMKYIDINMAINDADCKQEYSVWNKYINQLGNKSAAMEQGYFFAVKEAALIEISAVLAGSNELTPTIDNVENSKQEAPKKRNNWAILAAQLK